jgi:histidyl-tRNA synthetase
VAVGDGTLEAAFEVAERLRDEVTGIRVELNLGGGSFKSQLKRADKSKARYALILGEQEVADRRVGLKPLRSTEDQCSVAFEELPATLAGLLGKA